MNAAQYADALTRLFPPGKAFSRAPRSNFQALMLAFGDQFAAYDAALLDLIEEADPRTTEAMLPNWETLCGLPDPAIPAPVTLADRRTAVVNKLTWRGGITAADFIALAASLGYVATITLHTPFAAGVGYAGAPLYVQSSIFWWEMNVTVPEGTATPLVALEHYVRQRAPDHTYPTFNYIVA